MTAGSMVAGIDRWRGGWMVAQADAKSADYTLSLWQAADIDEVITQVERCSTITIDMPIALAKQGRRSAESDLRALLGSSARSVFTSPTRAAITADTQAAATVTNRAHGGPGVSAQAFGLFASIQELRQALQGPQFDHWWETHPESSFAMMNNGTPLASKRTARGVAQRLDHLRRHFPTVDAMLLDAPDKVPVDDVLDALAALWSAQRIDQGQAKVFGPAGRDDEGFAEGIRI